MALFNAAEMTIFARILELSDCSDSAVERQDINRAIEVIQTLRHRTPCDGGVERNLCALACSTTDGRVSILIHSHPGVQHLKALDGRFQFSCNRRFISLIRPQRYADRQQEDGALVSRVRRKELNHVIIEKRQPSRAETLRIRS